MYKFIKVCFSFLLTLFILVSCGNNTEDKVVIFTNADEEAIEVMTLTLNEKYSEQFEIVGYGSTELSTKLALEGGSIAADIVSLSSFYLRSLNEGGALFLPHQLNDSMMLEKYRQEDYMTFLAITGGVFYNKNKLKAHNLPVPQSFKDLAKPIYKGFISFPSLEHSSTGWLMIQALLANYEAKEAKIIVDKIKDNAQMHIETSGSAPIKKVESGEVVLGYGLLQQAEKRKNKGLPIEVIRFNEGNYSLSESYAIVNKGQSTKALTKEMLAYLVANSHEKMQAYYPSPVYKTDKNNALETKSYPEKLTTTLLAEHIQFFKEK